MDTIISMAYHHHHLRSASVSCITPLLLMSKEYRSLSNAKLDLYNLILETALETAVSNKNLTMIPVVTMLPSPSLWLPRWWLPAFSSQPSIYIYIYRHLNKHKLIWITNLIEFATKANETLHSNTSTQSINFMDSRSFVLECPADCSLRQVCSLTHKEWNSENVNKFQPNDKARIKWTS